jgi:glutamate-1-semialdehyde 2,1-aminomutase
MAPIDRNRLQTLMQREQKRFVDERPKSKAIFERGKKSLLLVFGKPIGAGVPGPAYGFTQQVADLIAKNHSLEDCDTGGIGGTLAGNALSLAAMRATLTKILTKEAFDRMIPIAQRWTAGVQKAIDDFGMP